MSARKAWGWSTDPEADKSQAITYAKTALRLGRQDALVLARSALVLTFNTDEVELADSLLDEAVHLDPNGMSGWMWGGWTKSILGEHRRAIDYHRQALRLSPLDVRIVFAHEGLAFAHFFLGNYEEGLRCAADAMRRHPTYVQGLRITMACYALSGNVEAAQKVWTRVALLSPTDRLSGIRKRSPWRNEELAKLIKAYRLAGMPE
jgi:adenylate cyclase